MFIDFEKITTTTIANFRGGEKEFNAKIYNDAVNKIMKGKAIFFSQMWSNIRNGYICSHFILT